MSRARPNIITAMAATKQMRYKHFLAAATLCAVAICAYSAPARAQTTGGDSLSLTITPPFFQLNVSPGDSWASSIKVVNTNPGPLTVYATVAGFTPSDELGHGSFLDLSSLAGDPDALANWITASSGPVTIAPGGTGEIPFSFNVPDNASPGGHYAAILIGTAPGGTAGGGSRIGVSSYISSLIFVTVSGDIVEQGDIDEFSTNQDLYENPDVNFTLVFRNSGNVQVRPVGNIEIYNAFGKERGVIDVNQTGTLGYVLSSSSRKFDFEWKGATSWFDIGPYTAVATLDYGDNGVKSTTETISFWILPVWKLLGAGLGTIFFIVIFVIAIRRYVRRALSLEMSRLGPPPGTLTLEREEPLARFPVSQAPYPPRAPDGRSLEAPKPKLNLRTLGEPVSEGIVDLRKAYEDAIIKEGSGQKGVDWAKFLRSLRKYAVFGMLFLLVLLGIIWMSLYISATLGSKKPFEVKNNDSGVNSQWVQGTSGQ
jgi:hypothetical protein